MAQFDETKVINTLHTDKAIVGKKYLYADNIFDLKNHIEHDDYTIGTLTEIRGGLFKFGVSNWYLLYPYDELPKKRMTNRQLFEWLAKGNGEYTEDDYVSVYNTYPYDKKEENNEVASGVKIRTWDSEEWVEPTVDIYERDCRKVRNDNFCNTLSIE